MSPKSLISDVVSNWRSGRQPDAREFLAHHPDLGQQKSLVLDLAYEEYCLRVEAGETIVPSTFCDRFPTYRRSLRRLLDVHECMHQDPELADSHDESAWPAPGSNFLGFDLIQEVGRGAFARVYLATEPTLGRRHVVVKIARGGAGEAETLGRLDHCSIVPVFSVSRDDATRLTAICMPYLGSATLNDVLDLGFAGSKPPNRAEVILRIARQAASMDIVPEAHAAVDKRLLHLDYVGGVVHLLAQLADALAHAHQRGVLHRDLKPSNILLTPAGRPMLLDFNLSSDQQREIVRVGGTLPYMSPEQLQAVVLDPMSNEVPVDPRWDIFSLGVILYELLTGRLPFGDKAPEDPPDEAARRIWEMQHQGCPPPQSLNPHVSKKLAQLIQQTLHVDAAQRPDSARQLSEMLRTHLMAPARLNRWVRRRKLLVGASGSALLLLSSLGIGGQLLRPPFGQREYQAGITVFQSGDYEQAIMHFTRAHDALPHQYQPLLGRAYARRMCGKVMPAIDDLETLVKTQPRADVVAELAYCCDLGDLQIPAGFYYGMAIDQLGVDDARTWNNRGYNARRRHLIGKAIEFLNRAIALDSTCQAAYHNRALVYETLAQKQNSSGSDYGTQALADIEKAIDAGPAYSVLMFDAARLHALYNQSSNKSERVIVYLCRALDLGTSRNMILGLSLLKPFCDEQVLQHPEADVIAAKSELLIPPRPTFPNLGRDPAESATP